MVRRYVGLHFTAITIIVLTFSSGQHDLDDTNPGKGLIPLVSMRLGTPVRQLRDCNGWKKIAARRYKRKKTATVTQVGDGQNLESEHSNDSNEDDSKPEEEEEKEPTKSRPQPKFGSGTVRRQPSVQLVTSDNDVIRPRPPPPSTVHVGAPRWLSTHHDGAPIDPRSHEVSVLPNN